MVNATFDAGVLGKIEIEKKEQEFLTRLNIQSSFYQFENSRPDYAFLSAENEHITKFSVYQFYIPIIPEGIENLTNLKELCMYEALLEEMPENIGSLKKLEKLYLNCNTNGFYPNSGIKKIPESLKNLTGLKELNLAFNEIDSFIIPKGLEYLGLGYNHVSVLPEEFYECKNLKRVELHDNHLSTIDERIGNLKELTYIDLRNNYSLTKLPENIARHKGLKKIEFYNKIKKEQYQDIINSGEAGLAFLSDIVSFNLNDKIIEDYFPEMLKSFINDGRNFDYNPGHRLINISLYTNHKLTEELLTKYSKDSGIDYKSMHEHYYDNVKKMTEEDWKIILHNVCTILSGTPILKRIK